MEFSARVTGRHNIKFDIMFYVRTARCKLLSMRNRRTARKVVLELIESFV